MYTRYFSERPDSIETPIFNRLYETFVKELDPQLLEQLPRISFVMLKPDTYLRGIIPDVVRSLISYDLYPAKYQLVQMTETMIDDLYMFVKQKYFESWWIMKKVYRLAPTFPILLIGDPKQYDHLSGRIREIVGATTPLVGRPEQIRYDYRATHRIFNVIHATDDPAAAIREALVFFSKDEIIATLKLATQDKLPSIQLDAFRRYIPDSPIRLEYSAAKYRVKNKLFNRMENRLENVPALQSEIFQYTQRLKALLMQEEIITAKQLPLRDERDQLKPILESQTRVLSLLLRKLSAMTVSAARNDSEVNTRVQVLSIIPQIKMLAELMYPFTSEIIFFESNIDAIIGALHAFNLESDSMDEAVLHAGWAVALNELNDLEFKNPQFVSGN